MSWLALPSSFAWSGNFSVVLSLCGGAIAAAAVSVAIREHRRNLNLKAELKKLRADFSRANERAASFRGEKGHILRIAEQHIAEPLSELSRSLDQACADAVSSDPNSALYRAAEQLRRIQHGVTTLTEIQTLDERSRAVFLRTINIGAVAQEAALATRSAAEKKSIRLSLPAPSKTSLARGDATILRKVLATLLYQAIEVSPVAAAVSLSLYSTSDRVLITVNDEGPGTVSTDQAHILSQSGDSRPPMTLSGAEPPLNLAMAHNLVKAMQGWLWSQSEPGRGTTHVIELPLPSQAEDVPFLASR